MAYPAEINNLIDVTGTQTLAEAGHAQRHNDANTALESIRDFLNSGTAGQVLVGVASASAPSWTNMQSNRNLLYNGAMQVAQRGTSTTGFTAGGYLTVDRWLIAPATLGTWTQDIQNDAPTGSGFRRSLRLLCTTADASPAAGDYFVVQQALEGQDLQRIRKGTSSAQKLTLSFWVKSNVTGTYIVNLRDNDNTRIACASYTISASATWERKTITFPADTTGAFDNDNNSSLSFNFWVGAGSNFTSGTLQTTWASEVTANTAPGQTNLASAINNYWQITGVQLEVGDVATDFEFKSYGQELRECQRYYYRVTASTQGYMYLAAGASRNTTTDVVLAVSLPTTMRAVPSAIEYSTLRVIDGASGQAVTALTTSTEASTQFVKFDATVASGLSTYRPYWLTANNSTSAYFALSAEL